MSQKEKFHRMTRPMRFRKFRMFKQRLVLWCRALRERIKYLFNYLLYKLNILKRYSYRDMVEKVVPLPSTIEEVVVESNNTFKGVVKMQLFTCENIDLDYFYFKRKDGSKKITLSLRDQDDIRVYTTSHLEDIDLRIGNSLYCLTDRFPTIKVALLNPLSMETHDCVEYQTVTYDIRLLKNIRHTNLIGMSLDSIEDISKESLQYYYEFSCKEIRKYLDNLRLSDLMVVGENDDSRKIELNTL